MRLSSLFGPAAIRVAAAIVFSAMSTRAQSSGEPPSPNLDFSRLGRVALAGDFDAISLYSSQSQSQNALPSNGSNSLLQQLPNGIFTQLQNTDAMIMAMCPFVRRDGTLAGVVVGGNFTSLNGVEARGAALWNPGTNEVVPLTGINGSVNALFCDQNRDTVYVGGDFFALNSTNAIAWVGMDGWANMPFAGFDGPVTSVVRAPNNNIIFGGTFTGLGNMSTPGSDYQQTINLQTADITFNQGSPQAGFSDPRNVICSGGEDGPGTTWLTADNGGGSWGANFSFGFVPRRLRLYNTHLDGRGTRTFRYYAYPLNGIMRFNYTDPASGENRTCDESCPLSDDPNVEYQDFTFVNEIGMNSFQIDILEVYGAGGGFRGIELFQDDIFVYAVSAFNEPTCANSTTPSNSTRTGPWTESSSGSSNANFLTADLSNPSIDSSSVEVTLEPDIRQSGNYTVVLYTPGCQQSNSCGRRGRVNVTGIFTSDGQFQPPQAIYQTNDFEKYDQIYTGPVDLSTDSFRPRIVISPWQEEPLPLEIVALRAQFMLREPINSGLNGIYEFDPDRFQDETSASNSTFNAAGEALSQRAEILSLAVVGDTTYLAGNFSNDEVQNIFALSDGGNITGLPGGGLNDAVSHLYAYGNQLYAAGNFTDTAEPSRLGVSYVAVFDTAAREWASLGAGVNGPVERLVPLTLNISENQPETCVTLNGHFTQVLEHQQNPAFSADGFAIWVPSRNNWLQNLNVQSQAIRGQLTAATNVTDFPPLLAGTLQSQGLALSNAISLSTSDGRVNISPLGFEQAQVADSSAATLRKRDVIGRNFTGANTGLFITDNDRNITVLAGSFQAQGSNDNTIYNVAFIRTQSDGSYETTGLGDGINRNSTFRTVSRSGNTLSLGGSVGGTVGGSEIAGLVQWDIERNDFVSPQPGPFTGDSVVVYALSSRPDSNDLYAGGEFEGAGNRQCPGLCYYDGQNWARPGQTLEGTVSQMMWQGNGQLLVAGNLSVAEERAFVATYQVENDEWTIPEGASAIQGPVSALAQANGDASEYWLAGTGANGSPYLILYDGSTFRPVTSRLGPNSIIRGLSVVSTSQDHRPTDFLPRRLSLMLTGTINVPSFGNASAAIFDGSSYSPLILSSSREGQGTLSQLITEQSQSFENVEGGMRVGYVVAISLAIALGVMFLLIAIGLLIERRRRKAEGYKPAPQNYFEKTANMGRIPPERLFSSLNQPVAPQV